MADRPAALTSAGVALAPHPDADRGRRSRARLGGGAAAPARQARRLPSFGFGGNKVRKIQMVAGRALAHGADPLITCGGVQSNHCRVTAAAGAALGLRCASSSTASRRSRRATRCSTRLFGAEVRYVASREERASAMEEAVAECFAPRARGRSSFHSAHRRRSARWDSRAAWARCSPLRPHARRHRPLHVVGRDAGRPGGGLRAARARDAGGRDQRR